MNAESAQRSCFGSHLFPIIPPDGVLSGVFADDVPRALPAGTLFGSLGRKTNRAARVVTANGSEFARIPMPRAPTACFLCRLLRSHYSPKPAEGKRAEKGGRISYQWSIGTVPASFAQRPERGERSCQVDAGVGRVWICQGCLRNSRTRLVTISACTKVKSWPAWGMISV